MKLINFILKKYKSENNIGDDFLNSDMMPPGSFLNAIDTNFKENVENGHKIDALMKLKQE